MGRTGPAHQDRRRFYVTEDDFSTYHIGDWREPVTRTINGRTYTNRWTIRNFAGQNRSRRESDAFMLASQNYFFRDRLVTTFGYRLDRIDDARRERERLAPDHPVVTSGQFIPYEWWFTDQSIVQFYKPTTRTYSGVFHATKWLSAFYNESSNAGPPILNTTLVPDGSTPPITQGRGRDYGLTFDLLDGRLFLRVNRFETTSARETIVASTGFFTEGSDRIATALLGSRIISQAEFDAHNVDGGGGLADSSAEGTEVTATANPTKNWALQFNYSHKSSDANQLSRRS